MKTLVFTILVALLGVGCAHHNDVRPGADGVHRVSIPTDDKEEAAREAIKQANHYCQEKNKSAVFIDESQKYTGTMDEEKYKTGKTAAKVAKGVGSAAWVFGGKNESNIGGIVGLGGAVADSSLGNGYTVEMKFKCD